MTALRLAHEGDAGAIAAIYAPLVERTAISFEIVPPEPAEIARRINATLESYPWLVLEREGRIEGYAYAGALRTRAAYDWSAETTVYVRSEQRGSGVGRALYASLLQVLRVQGFVAAYGVVTLPNPASVRLHEALGFSCVGVLPAVGFKLGCWHDVGFWRRLLVPLPDQPETPRPLSEIRDDPEIAAAIAARAC